MSVTHPTSIRNELCNLVVDKIDVGTDFNNGLLTFKQVTPAAIDLVSINFSNRPGAGGAGAFGDSAVGIATANGLPLESQVTANGQAQKATIYNCVNPRGEVLSCAVSDPAGAGDIKLSSVNLSVNDYVRMTVLSYEAPN